MKNITYGIVKETYCLGRSARISYGIAAYASAEDTATVLAYIGDITSNEEKLLKLVLRCNEFELSLLHFKDVVEDFINE